jgi:hypothetical protein
MANDFASIKIRRAFLAWLRQEAARRGIFVYELVEELAVRRFPKQAPWRRLAGDHPRDVKPQEAAADHRDG